MNKTSLSAFLLTLSTFSGMQAGASDGLIQNMLTTENTGTWAKVANHVITRSKGKVNITIQADGPVPTQGSLGAIGYGVITGVNSDGYPENVLALTSHLCVADSLVQGPAGHACGDNTTGLLAALFGINDEEHNDATWHAHFLDLKPATDICLAATGSSSLGLEVDLARTLATRNNVSPENEVIVNNDDEPGPAVSVQNLNPQDFHNAAFRKAMVVSFRIVAHADDNKTVTNLCLAKP
ncbi:hypothetical protein [Nitrosomonas halophila]|uniref:Uncharacterized protein n=1 Tax=Nitrosomonas halophila TaxID=44576 RepID=A0A1H3DXL6_9PROT|nr:hypothetical protein [Nitrosomonas halophila]SDX71165.1 hypothetical protein SAMN05421881_100659 [Nitrosomonas halophila]